MASTSSASGAVAELVEAPRRIPAIPRLLRANKVRRWLGRIAGGLVLLALLVLAFFWFATPLPDPNQIRVQVSVGNTRILDRAGRLIYAVPDPLTGRQQPVALSEIPLALQQATIAIEDASFYTNPGLDLRGIARAAWTNFQHGDVVAGGSTISQQLARTILLAPQDAQRQSLVRKLREAVLALKLNVHFSKPEILAMYLNQVYYGGLSYGVEAAAQRIFGKPVRDLDLAEAALLAGLPQAPGGYDPLVHPDLARVRQAQVLAAMQRVGFIDATTVEQAQAEPLQFHGAAPEMRAPHAVMYLLDLLTAEYGAEVVLRGGLTVTTTLDLALHEEAEAILRRQLAHLNAPQTGAPPHQVQNGAVVVLDPHDGAILALVGSPNFADAASAGQVNAALALRQPGSAIKPITYAAALEREWTAASLILDVPTSFSTREGRPYTPENYDATFHGPLSLRTALATSSNVAAVRVLDQIGIPALLDMANRVGLESLGHDSARYGLSLALGSGEVRPLELTAAYAALANGGMRVTPYLILAVEGAPTPSHRPPTPALSPQVAYLITDILADRFARMRAFGAQSALDLDRPAAAKTGTTSDWRDNWTLGYTPDRVVGVWVGNADGRPMRDVSGITGAAPIWNAVMRAAHRGLPVRAFVRPEGIVELSVCADSGMLPSPHCPATRLERFVAGTEPQTPDTSHVAVAVDRLLGCRAPASYPTERTVTQIFWLVPPEAEAWAVEHGVPSPPRRICQMAGDVLPDTPEPVLTWNSDAALVVPADGAIYQLSSGIPPERQQLLIQAVGDGTKGVLTIVIDGERIADLHAPPYRAFWQLTPGEHTAWVEVAGVRSGEIRFRVIE